MPESTEVLLARIDERTRQMHVDIKDIKGVNAKQDEEIDKLKAWRNGLAGAITAVLALIGLAFKLG